MPTAASFRCIGIRETLVEVQLLRVPNRPVVPVDRELKVEVVPLHLLNPWVSMAHRSDKCLCSIHSHLDSLHSSLSLDSFQDLAPDPQVVLHPARLAKEVMVVLIRDHNLDPRHSHLVVEDMVVQDRRQVHNPSLPEQVMVDRVVQHLLPDRNQLAVDTIAERME